MDKDENKEVQVESVSINDAPTPDTPDSETATDETEQLKNQISELNDKYLRAVAELENTRRRNARDMESVSRNRAMSVASDFLPVMDAIESALKQTPDDPGVRAMATAMESAFTRIGIVKIDSVGRQLDPQLHNAIQVVDKPTPDTATNVIVNELQPGYMFGDTVMRTAMVVVSK